jgi:hypothetical protein
MFAIRTRVRTVAIAWLLCQVASLSAFVPEHCCVSHLAEQAAKEKQDACHESEPAPAPEPGDACPMEHAAGAACPMHAPTSSDRCAMSNACEGPGTHLASLFAFVGAIEPPHSSAILLESSAALAPAAAAPRHRIPTIDVPPPKA